MNINISIIIPVYNVEKYLVMCLDSVINQSIPFDEVILVNDGSTDTSLSICKQYSASYKYIKLISQNNKGPSVARNIGMEYASGNYIMFLDSDDCLCSNTVRILKEHLRKVQYDGIFFDADIVYEDDCNYKVNSNGYDRKDLKIDNIEMEGIEYFSRCYPRKYVASACMAIYKRKLIEKKEIKFPEGLFFEDTYFSFSFTVHARCVKHISEKLYLRRYRNDSTMTSDYSGNKFIHHVKIGQLLWDVILKKQELLRGSYGELLLFFIVDYFRMILEKFWLCKNNNDVDKSVLFHFENIVKQYLVVVDKIYFLNRIWNISLLNGLLYNFHYIYLERVNINRQYIRQWNAEIVGKQKAVYLYLFKNILLDKKESVVGIYGMGKHTEGLLAIFGILVGDIVCDLKFIDSYLEKGEYRDKEIINYKKVDEKFDLVIISSFLYEREMVENILSVNNKVPIYRFYENINNDIFSNYKMFLEYC